MSDSKYGGQKLCQCGTLLSDGDICRQCFDKIKERFTSASLQESLRQAKAGEVTEYKFGESTTTPPSDDAGRVGKVVLRQVFEDDEWSDCHPSQFNHMKKCGYKVRELVLASDLDAVTAERDALRDLLRSAHAIAARKGVDTAWDRFAASCAALGAGPITARVYKVDGAAPEDIPHDSL